MSKIVNMVSRVERYLAYRRSLGYELHIEGGQLLRFARYADRIGHRGPPTTALALAWAQLPRDASPWYFARRLAIVRCFAKQEVVHDPQTEVPPKGLLGPTHCRKSPFIYSETQIAELVAAAAHLNPVGGLKPQTYQTLFGLLACTGLRVSEALRLTRPDVDLQHALLTIRETKFHKSRLVPLHKSAVHALQQYGQFRDHVCPQSTCPAFLLAPRGGFLNISTVHDTFRLLRRELGWHGSSVPRTPRIHDLRHTFTCRALLRWYREGADVEHHMTALSTYLGHVCPTSTYWYLTGTPELLAIAAARFERSTHADQRGAA
jgi:integrase